MSEGLINKIILTIKREIKDVRVKNEFVYTINRKGRKEEFYIYLFNLIILHT